MSIIELQAKLERIARALEMLKKTGYNKEVMISYIHDNSSVGKPAIRGVLEGQDAFFKAIGVKV